MFSANMVRQYSFLNQLMTDLENDPSKVCKRVTVEPIIKRTVIKVTKLLSVKYCK